MKRFVVAVVFGCGIPFLYAVIAAALTSYIQNQTIDRLIMYPIRWPILILYWLGWSFYRLPFESEFALMLYTILSNVVVYSIVSYFLLWRFSTSKKTMGHGPPKPPSFAQE